MEGKTSEDEENSSSRVSWASSSEELVDMDSGDVSGDSRLDKDDEEGGTVGEDGEGSEDGVGDDNVEDDSGKVSSRVGKAVDETESEESDEDSCVDGEADGDDSECTEDIVSRSEVL